MALSPILVIALKDLRQRLRDRSAIILGFIAPVAIAALMSLAFHNPQGFHATIGYVDLDHGPAAAAFTQVLGAPDMKQVITTRPYATGQQARQAVDKGTVQAAIVLPAGFSAAVRGTGSPVVTVLSSVDNVLPAKVCQAITDSFVAQVNADRLSVATALQAGAPGSRISELIAQAVRLHLPEQAGTGTADGRQLKTISYYAPGMGIFFVMFAVGFGSRGFFVERRNGTLDRISAAPLAQGATLAGKSLSTFVYALASLTTMAVVSTMAFGADWGDPVAVALLCTALSFSVVSLTAFVIVLARTERQAEALSSLIVFALALLGGNFVFISASPALLQRLALYTPNGWALRGFTDLGTGVHGAAAVGAPVAAILLFTLALTLMTVLLSAVRRRTA